MPPPSSPLSAHARFGLLLFVALPCLPGIIFLLAGMLSDPHRQARNAPPMEQTRFDHARERTRELYLAGGIVLLSGTACSGVVVWKIARSGPLPDDEKPETDANDAQT